MGGGKDTLATVSSPQPPIPDIDRTCYGDR